MRFTLQICDARKPKVAKPGQVKGMLSIGGKPFGEVTVNLSFVNPGKGKRR